MPGRLVVTYPLTERSRAIVAEKLAGAAEAIYLADLPSDQRAARGLLAPHLCGRDAGGPDGSHR